MYMANIKELIEKVSRHNEHYRVTDVLEFLEQAQAYHAQQQINKAINMGQIRPAKEKACNNCSNQAEQYHHPDYAYALEVIPLCNTCHGKIRDVGELKK